MGAFSLVVVAVAYLAHAPWAAVAAIASLPGVAIVNVVTGYVVGIKRVRYATTLAMATTMLSLVMMALGLFLVAKSAWVAIAVWVTSGTIVALIALVAMLVHARRLAPGRPVALRPYFALTFKVGFTGLVSLLNYRADIYLVALYLAPAELGLYTVAVAAAESLLVPTQVAALVTSPHIGGLEIGAAARLAARCVRNNLLIALVLCSALFVLAPTLVALLYGAAFLPLVPALRILMVGVVALSLGSPVSIYYTLKLGKPEIPLVLAGASAALCIAGAIVMIPHLGLIGAAIASTTAYIVGQGLGLGYFARSTGLSARAVLVPTVADLMVYYHYARATIGRTAIRFSRGAPDVTG
jgi:O-antigen/teichoic acid export membrane protein